MNEHDFEPIPGLPAPLPTGETILWQGAPDRRTFARRALRNRWVAAYFVILVVWGFSGDVGNGQTLAQDALSAVRLIVLGSVALCLLAAYAWFVARTTIYTVTTRRVVLRYGIALPMTLQIAYPVIDAATVKSWADGTGDISLALGRGERAAYLMAWPHVRPWRLLKAEPSLRSLSDVATIAQILSRALAASAAQPARSVSVSMPASESAAGHLPAPA